MLDSTARFAAFLLAALPTLANAEFFYRLNVNSIGATTCTTTQAQTAINGDLDWILPPTSGNLWISRRVVGQGTVVDFASVTPFAFDNQPVPLVSFTLPAPQPLPYAASLEFLPARNGDPLGTGFRVDWLCDAAGGGAFSVTTIIAPTAVPATSPIGFAALAALLALAGAVLARRRARALH